MSVSSIGPLLARDSVIDAFLAVLRTWLGTYLDDVERQRGLDAGSIPRPPSDASFRPGLDFIGFKQEDIPVLIVAAKPHEDALHRGSGDYDQWWEVHVAATCSGPDDVAAGQRADWYGAAVMGAIAQHDDLDGFAVQTLLVDEPDTEFINPKLRQVAQSVTVFHTLVQGVVNETGAPAAPVPEGETPPPVPDATSVNLTFEAVEVDEPVE